MAQTIYSSLSIALLLFALGTAASGSPQSYGGGSIGRHGAGVGQQPLIINRAARSVPSGIGEEAADEEIAHRVRRAAPTGGKSAAATGGAAASLGNLQHFGANITTKMNYLNDSHAQLMVHWLGDGTNVMICLAREPPVGPMDETPATSKPSSVYISYDYGDTFEDKTLLFRVLINGTEMNSTLDQFVTNQNYNTIVFTDPKNKAIFTNSDTGKTFKRHMLDFTPSEVIFYENDARTFLIFDKEDADRKLYYTTNFGESFDLLESNVKTVMWSSGDDTPVQLYVERKEPTNTSAVIFMNAAELLNQLKKPTFNVVIENVQDFFMRKDFLCATRKVLNNTHLYVSYKGGHFVKAEFQTELDILGLHIADVEGTRLMVSAVHSEHTCHLYVSESNEKMTEIKLVPSLENVFSYVPGLTWRTSWLDHTTDEAFTDIYKVEGLRGIYIASKVFRTPPTNKQFGSITPDHLGSLISFDHGASWKPIQAPTVDHEGQLINCTNCSLHLSQKFTQLYPITRSVPIMSSKSAPGVIMATGVVGKSMKGHPCVYLSRDAGQTWKQILKNYHFFNYGDHGGVLVTVKFFKAKGETNEILYSIDEGEKWMSYKFHSTDLKMYGLMTEPNTNSTVFTLFGSEVSEHRWLIVKVDLKNAFEYNCTADDYKFWSPGARTGDSIVPCVLGLQETYQRRAAHAKCYNGKNYDRPVRSEVCDCGRWDFECDAGFTRLNVNAPCVRNKQQLLRYDPYAIPASCASGEFYNRTKGYRRIAGDVCVEGDSSQYLPQRVPCPFGQANDFLIVAQRDMISRIEIPSGKKEVLPVDGLKNVIAIEFDIRQNCVFWADILTDAIGRQCFNGNQSRETLLDVDLASVEGMSYDWVSELLYFVDGTRLKIEAITTSEQRYGKHLMRKTIVERQHLSKPRGIVVHPLEGYLFWTDWSQSKPAISRANLDGTNIRVLFSKPQIVWPNGITIDFIAERVYWVDASKDYIASCDLNGQSFRKILEQDTRVAHPFAVAVFKDHMFWDDWKMNSVFSADKDHGSMIRTLADRMPSLMDVKIYAHSIQTGTNACNSGVAHNCSHICVAGPRKTFSCLCPDGMEVAPNGNCNCPGSHQPFANKTCPELGNTCPPTFFQCANHKCIPKMYRCDGENDCRDNSDEVDCPNVQCPALTFGCASDNKCIPEYFRCDHDKDCTDGSDEQHCNFTDCLASEFKCNNGRCINQKWKCDGEDDCRDGSDEQGCTAPGGNGSAAAAATCMEDDFRCIGDGKCISKAWRCDNDQDCADGSDEANCDKRECDPWMFNCKNGRCVFKTWHCDGDLDCDNGEDEANCTYALQPVAPKPADAGVPQCHDWMFKCTNGRCVPFWWKCDGVLDCSDGSDELGCPVNAHGTGNTTSTSPTTTTTAAPPPKDCSPEQFRCDSGRCLSKVFVCDGDSDCPGGEDELFCAHVNCDTQHSFKCYSDGVCLPLSKYCNGVRNCVDGSDEDSCDSKSPHAAIVPPLQCPEGYFACDNTCSPQSARCDGRSDCYDGTDEEGCNGTQRMYQVNFLYAYTRTINATSFLVFWYMPPGANRSHGGFEYLPSISVTGSNVWRNHTAWIANTEHRFVQLEPYTHYNVTVYVRERNQSSVTAAPYAYVAVTTAEGYPSEPQNVTVRQLSGSSVQVSWEAPKVASGLLKEYTVYYNEQTVAVQPAKALKVSPLERSLVLESNFEGNRTYAFWVKARNMKHESPSSKLVRLTFNDDANMDRLTGLQTTSIGADFIELAWDRIPRAQGYLVQPVLPQPFPKLPSNTTAEPRIRLENLMPGGHINIKVSAFNNNIFGRVSSLSVVLKGIPLPEVPQQSIFNDGKEVKLRWNQPNPPIENVVYGIYYGTTLDELFEKPRLTTTETTIEVTDLKPCAAYLLSVGIVGPKGPGPLSHNPLAVETDFVENSPPQNVLLMMDETRLELVVSWENVCTRTYHSPAYTVTLVNLRTNHTRNVTTTFQRGQRTMQHTFDEILRGATYNVSVRTKAPGGEVITKRVNGPELPAPRQLKVYPEKNGTYVVFWKPLAESWRLTYELIVVEGLQMRDNLKPILSRTAAAPPFMINPSDLGGVETAGKVFTFGVRSKSKEGYHSPIREIEHIEVQPDAWLSTVLPTSTSMWLVLVPLAVVAALAGTVVYLVQRHRRLANSFSRFANSHYDTRTGATRIGDALDEDDHNNESPRFEDDEPLVIA